MYNTNLTTRIVKTIVLPNTKNEKIKQSFGVVKKIIKESAFFICFEFLNVLIPIFICMLTSISSTHGAYATIGVGYVTAFQLAYTQVGFGFAIYAFFALLKKQNESIIKRETIYTEGLFLSTLLGLIMIPLYIGPSYVYTKFANNHINTIDSINDAYDYIFSSSGFVLLSTISSFLTVTLKYRNQTIMAIIYEILGVGIVILFAAILEIYADLGTIGIGLGLTIGSLLNVIVLLIVLFILPWKRHTILSANETVWRLPRKENCKYIILRSWRPLSIILSIQFIKAFALLFLNYSIPETMTNAVPLDYQMARLVWYNYLYLIPFCLVGLSDAINFHYSRKVDDIVKGDFFLVTFVVFIIGIIVSVVVAIVISYMGQPIIEIYIKNMDHSYTVADIRSNIYDSVKELLIKKINNLDIPQTLKDQMLKNIDIITEVALDGGILDKYTIFDTNDICKMIFMPKSYSYLYIAIFSILYNSGSILNQFINNHSHGKIKVGFLICAQIAAISFVVVFGIRFQETTTWYLMDAWSFPLMCIGGLSIIYFIFIYFVKLRKYESEGIKNIKRAKLIRDKLYTV